MPELPEVETVRRGLQPILEGARLTEVQQRRADLRYPFPANLPARLAGRRVDQLRRRSKYLLADLDDGGVLLLHLGMSGRIQRIDDPSLPLDPHDHLLLHTDSGAQLRFNDPRRFGFVDLFARADEPLHPRLRHLGPEPLGNGFSPAHLAAAAAGRKLAIKQLIMNASVVVGVGNIYASESLAEAGLHPERPAGSLDPAEIERLTVAIRAVLTRAIDAGGSSISDYVQVSGELGYFQHQWRVYGREAAPCRVCQTGIVRLVLSNRSTFFCPQCQR